MRILVDTSVIEVYAMNGRAIGTYMYLPPDPMSSGVRVRLGGAPHSPTEQHNTGGCTGALVESVYEMLSAYSNTY